MSDHNTTIRNTSDLADKVFWYQLHVFQVCFTVFCTLPCLAFVIWLFPKLAAFMGTGPQRSSMLVLKVVMVAAPSVLLFAGFAYLAYLLAAVIHVFIIRLLIPALRMPEASAILLQFYSDRRWLYQGPGTKHFPWWISLWSGMEKNKRLIRACERLTAWTVPLVYGRATHFP